MDQSEPKRGDIYYVKLDTGSIGSEQSGTRPALIIQNNTGNHFSPTTIVAFITTRQKPLPTHVPVSTNETGLHKESYIMLEQIRTIDKSRLMEKIGKASFEEIQEVNNALYISFGIKK